MVLQAYTATRVQPLLSVSHVLKVGREREGVFFYPTHVSEFSVPLKTDILTEITIRLFSLWYFPYQNGWALGGNTNIIPISMGRSWPLTLPWFLLWFPFILSAFSPTPSLSHSPPTKYTCRKGRVQLPTLMSHRKASCCSQHQATASIQSLQTPAKSKGALLWSGKACGQKKLKPNQHKWKLRALTFWFSLTHQLHKTMSAMAGTARTIQLPITWYLRAVEKAHQALLQPSKMSPLWDQPAQCVDSVSRVRNKGLRQKLAVVRAKPLCGQQKGKWRERQLMMLLESSPFSYPSWTFCLSHAPMLFCQCQGLWWSSSNRKQPQQKCSPYRTSKPYICCPSELLS